ncbi:MAG TPA: hypothetical protein VKI44_28585 [Acetobacteraceae bacterium]|nr:hypothetical protein [Acetobacteraceae bacterium]
MTFSQFIQERARSVEVVDMCATAAGTRRPSSPSVFSNPTILRCASVPGCSSSSNMPLCDVAEAHQRFDPLAAAQQELAAPAREEQRGQHPVSEQPVEFRPGREDQEQHEDPELNEDEAVPGEVTEHESAGFEPSTPRPTSPPSNTWPTT